MNAKQFLEKYGRERCAEVAAAAETNFAYFSQIAYGHRHPSRNLARRLSKASNNEMTFIELMMPDEKEAA